VLINAVAEPGPAPPGRAQLARIAFTRVREDVRVAGDFRLEAEIWVMNADFSGARRVTRNTSDDFGVAWSPDGRTLLFGASQFGADSTGTLVLLEQNIFSVDVDSGTQTHLAPRGKRANSRAGHWTEPPSHFMRAWRRHTSHLSDERRW
jgi:hypothetical protein